MDETDAGSFCFTKTRDMAEAAAVIETTFCAWPSLDGRNEMEILLEDVGREISSPETATVYGEFLVGIGAGMLTKGIGNMLQSISPGLAEDRSLHDVRFSHEPQRAPHFVPN